MNSRPVKVVALLFLLTLVAVGGWLALRQNEPPPVAPQDPPAQNSPAVAEKQPDASIARETPRTLDDGRYLLPNGWSLSPAGRQLALGGLPLKIVPCPDSRHILALSCGSTPHFLAMVDVKTEEVVQKRQLKQCWFGLAVHPDGKTVWVAAGTEDVIRVFDASNTLAERKPIPL